MVLIGQSLLGLPFWPAVALALVGAVALGALVYGGFMRPLRNASLLAKIIATLAIGTVLREFLRAYMGPNAWPFPSLLPPTAVEHRRGRPAAERGAAARDARRHDARAEAGDGPRRPRDRPGPSGRPCVGESGVA